MGRDGVGLALDKSIAVGFSRLGSEVVHLIIEQKTCALDGDTGAISAIQCVGVGDGVPFRVDH